MSRSSNNSGNNWIKPPTPWNKPAPKGKDPRRHGRRGGASRRKLTSLSATHEQAVQQLRQQLDRTTRSLEQTRVEKETTLADLATKEQDAARKLASLTATHEQAVQQLRQQLDQTTHSLEQTRTEKETTLADLATKEQDAAQKTCIPHRHP